MLPTSEHFGLPPGSFSPPLSTVREVPLKPAMTALEASGHIAQAGIAGRVAAEAAGGDPTQVRAIVSAALAQPPTPGVDGKTQIGGVELHSMTLLVSLCLPLYQQQAATQRGAPNNTLDVACMAYIFARPALAYSALSAAPAQPLVELEAEALTLTGHWLRADIEQFSAYMQTFAQASTPTEETAPGKSQPQMEREEAAA